MPYSPGWVFVSFCLRKFTWFYEKAKCKVTYLYLPTFSRKTPVGKRHSLSCQCLILGILNLDLHLPGDSTSPLMSHCLRQICSCLFLLLCVCFPCFFCIFVLELFFFVCMCSASFFLVFLVEGSELCGSCDVCVAAPGSYLTSFLMHSPCSG